MGSLITSWRGTVAGAWVGYNGHLNDAYYMVIFSYATDALMASIGLDAEGRKATGHTMYTLEVHLNYVREVHAGVAVEVHTQLLGADSKRVHVFHNLLRSDNHLLLATNEQMLSNIDTADQATGPRTAPFAPGVAGRLWPLVHAHAHLPKPPNAGRHIALPAPKPFV